MKAPSLLVTGLNQIELGEVEIPEPGYGELLIQAELTAVSPGTELRAMAGKQAGTDIFPYVPGYAMLGKVATPGPGTEMHAGTRVFCNGTKKVEGVNRMWGGHVAYAVVPESSVHRVPEKVTAEDAAMAKLGAISFHGYRTVMAGALDDVVVLGLGPIGMLSALIHKAAGPRVMALDPIEARRKVAIEQGIPAFAPDDPEAKAHFPQLATVVVDSTGAPPVLRSALEWLRAPEWNRDRNPRHYLVVQGSYGNQDIALDYQEAFKREATIVVPRDSCPPDYRDVLSWCAAGKLKMAPILSGSFPPAEAPQIYQRLLEKDPELITVAFRWS